MEPTVAVVPSGAGEAIGIALKVLIRDYITAVIG